MYTELVCSAGNVRINYFSEQQRWQVFWDQVIDSNFTAAISYLDFFVRQAKCRRVGWIFFFFNVASVFTSTVNVRFVCQSFRIKDLWPLSSFCRNIQQLHSEKYIREQPQMKCVRSICDPACDTAHRRVRSRGLDSYFYWTRGPLALPLQSL